MKILTNEQIPFARFPEVMDAMRAALASHAIPAQCDTQGTAMICASAMAGGGSNCLMFGQTDEGKCCGILLGVVVKNPIEGIVTAQAQLVSAFGDNKSTTLKELSNAFVAWSKSLQAVEVAVMLQDTSELEGFTKAFTVFAKKVEA